MRTLTTSLLLLFFSGVALIAQTADVTQGCAPLTVRFTPPAGVSSFFWDFKDGTSSVIASPINIFTVPGTYDVEFRQTPTGPILGTVTISVYPRPEVFVAADPSSGCVPLSVQFTDSVVAASNIQILGYSWVFGDGSIGSGASPAHVYTATGSFTVSVELSTNFSSCNITQVFPDLVEAGTKPNVDFTTTPTPPAACQPPLTVSFFNTTSGGSGTLTYAWDFGNGNTSTLVNPPAQTYDQLGTFTVTLTASDLLGCSATATRIVRVGPPMADFTVSDTVCLGATVLFLNNSDVGLYQWTFGQGAVPPSSQATNPQVSFSTPGLHNITLQVRDAFNCVNTVTKPIFVEDTTASFTAIPSYACDEPTLFTFISNSSNAVTWEWTFSDGSTASGPTATYTWRVPDTSGYSRLGLWLDTVYLHITTPAGCVGRAFRVDSIWLPNARFMPDVQRGCAPLEVTFSDSSTSRENIVRWTWLFDDGSLPLTVPNEGPVTHIFAAPGDYRVRLVIENSAGCIDTSYAVLIEVGEPIAGDFTADKTDICPGDTVQFINLTNDPRVDGWHFSSESDRLWHCYQNQNPTWVYRSETGDLSVSLTTDYNGCFFTVTKDSFIRVRGPLAKLYYSTTCANEKQFTFVNQSQGATSVTWYLGTGDTTTIDTSFTYLYTIPNRDYTVILKAENPSTGCPTSYDTAVVCPRELRATYTLPDTICGGQIQTLDASSSTGVNAVCYKGYTWYFSFQRPVRTDQPTLDVPLGPSGLQSISLEVESVNGCRDTLERTVFIYNVRPQIAVDKDRICIPGTVSFEDLSTADTTLVKWEWSFGDGTKSTERNPTHTYTTPPPTGDEFLVELRVEDAYGCVGYAQLTIKVYKPVSFISTFPSPARLCVGDSLQLAATDFTAEGSNLSWAWTLGNGQTAVGQQVTTAYSVAGQYTVKVVFTENATGCRDSTFATVEVQAPPQASFLSNVDNQSIICYPQNMLFTNNTPSTVPLSIQWDLGNGVQVAGNQAATVFPKGTFTVRMVAQTPFGCRDTVERTFTVVGPEGTFEMDRNLICAGDSVVFRLKDTASVSSWEWVFGDGTTASSVNPVTHVYAFRPPTNTTVARLVLRGEDDVCSISVEMPVNFSPVRANFTLGSLPCVGAPVQFLNTSIEADLSSWHFGDGGTSNLLNPTYVFAARGNYTVTLIVTDLPLGCRDTFSQDIAIGGIPNLQLFGDTVCAGDTALIGIAAPALPGAAFTWSPANLVLPPQNADIVRVRPTQTTTFTVSIVTDTGCRDTASVAVVVPTAYDGGQNLDTIITKGESVLLPVSIVPGYLYLWEPVNVGNPPLVRPDTTTTYILRVRDILGCTERQYTFRIQVVPERVYAPNAFTPDGDGNNDIFGLLADGDDALVRVLTLRVYNRWGELVYEGTGPLNTTGWNGVHNGKPAPSDVYAWLAEVEFLTGKKVLLKGDVTLLR